MPEEEPVKLPASPAQDMGLAGINFGDSASQTLVDAIKGFFGIENLDAITDLNIGQIRTLMIIRHFALMLHPSAYGFDDAGNVRIDSRHPSPFVRYDAMMNPYFKLMSISNKRLGRTEGKSMLSSVLGFNPREGEQAAENASGFFSPGKMRQ